MYPPVPYYSRRIHEDVEYGTWILHTFVIGYISTHATLVTKINISKWIIFTSQVKLSNSTLYEITISEGSVIPKGTTTLFFVYGLHRNPEIYPEPDVFKPERFLNENATSRNPFFYIPFSAGPRNCIGNNFSKGCT